MVKRGSIISLALLCALACLAVGATSASAKGTTIFTCVPAAGGEGYNDAHCKEGVTKGAKFEKVAVKVGEETEVVAKSLNTEGKTVPFIGQFMRGGFQFEFTCSGVEMEGTVENKEVGGVMQNAGKAINFKMVSCEVNRPASQECKIKNKEIAYPNLIGTTFEGGIFEMGIEFEPAAGKKLGELVLEGCKTAALNGAIEISGSFVALMEGVTLVTTAATTEGTLKFGGEKAVMGTVLTTRKAPVAGKEQNPLFMVTS